MDIWLSRRIDIRNVVILHEKVGNGFIFCNYYNEDNKIRCARFEDKDYLTAVYVHMVPSTERILFPSSNGYFFRFPL